MRVGQTLARPGNGIVDVKRYSGKQ